MTKFAVGFFSVSAGAAFSSALTTGCVALLCLEKVIQNNDVKIGSEMGLAVSFLWFVGSVCCIGAANCADEALDRRAKKDKKESFPA